jgi:hypothetical protein
MDRKADAYRKIQLGGLLIKAGLFDLAERLKNPAEVVRLKSLGDAEFASGQGTER